MVIGELALWEKTGGRSGHWRRETAGLLGSAAPDAGRSLPIEDQIDGLIGSDMPGLDG
jgi:hypothetical protein